MDADLLRIIVYYQLKLWQRGGGGARSAPPLVSRGQTAYFSFDMGAEKNKGLAYYRYMFCAENRQILAIVDWPLIGVDTIQRHSNDT